jgi:hypothetical protein
MPYAITKEQMDYLWKGCLANMEKDDSVIFLRQATFHKDKMLSVMNNKELKVQAKMWRKQRKEGLIQIQEYNNKTKDVDGKEYYSLVVQPTDLDNADIDPLGLLKIGLMVSGFVYVFKNKTNRDIIYEYVNKV